MEIQYLSITNIASIEQADIDFANEPLASDGIFLITGDTGSGKSTILNSICLALYNKVPALEALPRDLDKDVRQLMRKNTGQSRVVLDFIGNDQNAYRITWECHRAHNSPTGKLQSQTRSLEDISTGNTLTNFKEIEAEVRRLVGLDYHQFMRTTMLAQGQFANFLKGSESDKTDILEKLTNTDIYGRIGKEISEQHKDAKKQIDIIEAEIRGLHLLNDQERADIEQQRSQASQRHADLSDHLARVDKQANWLERQLSLNQQRTAKEHVMQTAQRRVTSDEIAKERLQIQQWDATADIRRALLDTRQSSQSIKQMTAQLAVLGNEPWHAIQDGLAALENAVSDLEAKQQALTQTIQHQAVFSEVYDNAQAIKEKSRGIALDISNHQKHQSESLRLSELARQSALQEVPLAQQLAQDQAMCTKKEKEAEIARIEKDSFDIQAITKERQQLTDEIDRLRKAQYALQNLERMQAEHQQAADALVDIQNQLNDTRQLLDEASAQLSPALIAYQSLESRLQGQMELRDHIASLRRQFADTGECPLCGNKNAELRTDEAINVMIQDAQQAAQQAKEAWTSIEAQVNKHKAALLSLNKLLETAQSTLSHRQQAVIQAQQKAQTEAPGYTMGEIILIEQGILIGEKQKSLLDAKLSQANEKRDLYEGALSQLAEARQALAHADKALREQKQNTQRLNADAQNLSDNAQAYMQNALDRVDEIVRLSKCDTPQEDIMFANLLEQSTGYSQINLDTVTKIAQFIVSGAQSFNKAIDDRDQCAEDIAKIQQDIRRLRQSMMPLTQRFTTPYTPKPSLHPDLEARILSLNTQASALDGQISAEQQVLDDAQRIIDKYLATSTLALSQIESLCLLTPQQIASYRQDIKDADEQLAVTKSQLNMVNEQLEHLNAERPDMEEGVTLEDTRALRDSVAASQQEAFKEINELEKTLRDDLQTRDMHAAKLAKRQQLIAIADNWSKLHKAFGVNEGKNFRILAQSYILHLLLVQANHYLERLMPRYRLTCNDGVLAIDIKDLHNRASSRDVSSLSGGESFVVSLALALGLSSLGSNDIRVGTLFIDEGFGSLDEHSMIHVIDVLKSLHHINGRRIGIISHVKELKHRIATQIDVYHTSPSSSSVRVVTL